MKNILATLLLSGLIAASCNSTSRNIFSRKTPHEKYADQLEENDLEKTPAGRQWLAASKSALADPQLIQLPYKQQGYFAPDKPRALGLKFTAKQGERLIFTLDKKAPFVVYADLYKNDGTEPLLLLSADTAAIQFSLDIDEPGSYVLRLQPELFRTGEYNLSVAVGPSLGFPIGDKSGKIGSVWGDSRDGGKRRHEGIDIFAPKRTPVVAAADGVITGVKEEGIGGKVVWLRLQDKNITLYYAHLDKQLVSEGQYVKKGEPLGLVGNTGNAKNTPSHLHFGIYTSAGPIDPYCFVNKEVRTAPPVADKNLKGYLRLIKAQKLNDGNVAKANTLLLPIATNTKGYISELPDGKIITVPFAAVQPVSVKKNDVAGKLIKNEKRS